MVSYTFYVMHFVTNTFDDVMESSQLTTFTASTLRRNPNILLAFQSMMKLTPEATINP